MPAAPAPAAPAPVGTSPQAHIGFNHTDLNGWALTVAGGSEVAKGSVRPGSALLSEGDSFLVGLERAFVVPAHPAPVVFTYTDLDFDTSDPGSIKDAFEASLVDPSGTPLVHTFTTGRDAYFNITETLDRATGPGVTETGAVVKTVTLDVSDVLPGTAATLRFRLVNNDHDTGTTVRILDVFVPTDDTGPVLGAIPDQSVPEGTPISVPASFTDPDDVDTHTAAVNWGDGATSDATVTARAGGGDVSAVHTYADNGIYAASMTVTDGSGASSTRAFQVVVTNVAPTLSISGPTSVDEGSLYLLSLASSDPGTDTIDHWTITWGDGTVQTVPGNPSSVSHTYADGLSTYTISATATDEDGTFAAGNTVPVQVLNVAPTLSIVGPGTVVEGSLHTLTLASSDPGADTIDHWTVTWGDGTVETVAGSATSVAHTYGDGLNTYTISATATDEDGTFAAGNTIVVLVTNAAPALSISGAPSATEASPYLLSFSSNDPGTDTIDHWTISWGDGTVQTVAGNPTSVSHTFADGPNTFTISATATDEDGTFAAGNTVTVSVSNVAPTLAISGADSVPEGAPYALALSATDPGADTIDHWTVTWGDGSVQTVSGHPGTVSHVYADGVNNYVISATATDEDGTFKAGNTVAVRVLNVAPALGISGAATVAEGTPYTLSLSSSDPGADRIDHWTVNWGDGQTQIVPGNPASVTHSYADGPTTRTITAAATDEDGTYTAGNTVTVQVGNVAPTLSISGASTVTEGTPYQLALAASDPGADLIDHWTINWGDGTVQTVPGHPTAITHTYADGPKNGTISATATDEDGTFASNSLTVGVTNVVPTVTGKGASVSVKTATTMEVGQFSDPGFSSATAGTQETFTAVIDWGDGTTSTGTVSTTQGSAGIATIGSVLGTHTFATADTFTGTVTVTDDDGGRGTAPFVVQVADGDPNRAVVRVPGTPGSNVTLTFDWRVREAVYNNELGLFVVDNSQGKIGTKMPGDPGYWKAALDRAQVIFTNTQTAGASRKITLPAGAFYSMYLVKNGTTTQAKQQPASTLPSNPNVWFPFKAVNPDGFQHYVRTDLSDGRVQFEVEDTTNGGDKDFDDMVFTVSVQAPAYAGRTRFFVADKGSDEVLRYDTGGAYVGAAAMDTGGTGNTEARGVASNAQGTRQWVVDADKRVYVYSASGNALGSWAPGSLSTPQGITTDGTDIWIVDGADHKVRRYKDAAGRTSGSAGPTNTYSLDSSNSDPSDIVTRGGIFWVTDDRDDQVYVYDIVNGAFRLLGHWHLDGANGDASGLTLDPTGASTDLWVVDRADHVVYTYTGGTAWRDGSRTASGTFALAVADTQPEGIADPPVNVVEMNFDSLPSNQGWTYESFAPGAPGAPESAVFSADGTALHQNTLGAGSQGQGDTIYARSVPADPNLPFRLSFTARVPAADGPQGSASPGFGVAFFSGTRLYSLAFGASRFVDSTGTVMDTSIDASVFHKYRLESAPGNQFRLFVDDTFIGLGQSREFVSDAHLDFGDRTGGANARADITAYRFEQLPYEVSVAASAPAHAFPVDTGVLISGTTASVVSELGLSQTIVGVSVDGVPVDALDPSGHFFTRVTVRPGQNTFTFAATDALGQTATTTLTLTGTQPAPGAIDFTSLAALAPTSFIGEYGRTSWQDGANVLHADLAVRNTGQYPAETPLLVGITNLSDPTVRVQNPDGVTPDGIPYFDYSALVTGGLLAPGQTSGSRGVAFLDPNRAQFTYDLVFLGHLNQAPTITSVPDVEAVAGRPYAYAVTASDPEGDPLTYSLVTAPSGMTIDHATGRITWNPAAGAGVSDVRVRVEDGNGGSSEQRYALSVVATPPNRPPVFTSVPVVSATVGSAYSYQATATDADGDALTFSVVSGPPGLGVNGTSGVVSWNPSATQVGPQSITLRVSDGRGGTATQTFAVLAEAAAENHAPVIVTDPVTTAVPGQTYHYDVNAIDPDGDPLAYSLTDAPDGMAIDPATGQITWAVSADQPRFGFAFGLGGTGLDSGRSVAIDPTGNVYMTGGFTGVVDFDPGPGVTALDSGVGRSFFLAKYAETGALLWARNSPATGTGSVNAFGVGSMVTDAAGNLYLTTTFSGTVDFDFGPGVAELTSDGASSYAVWKLDATGNLGWVKRVGGPGSNTLDSPRITLDPAGNVLLVGEFAGASDFDPGPGTFTLTSTTPFDSFAVKLSPSGNFVWAKSWGLAGTGSQVPVGYTRAVADPAGGILISGAFQGTVDFDPGAGTYPLTALGYSDAFLLRLDDAGAFVSAQRWGGDGPAADLASAITLDADGNIYLTGFFNATADMDPGPGVVNLTSAGNYDAFVSKLDPSGRLVWTERFGSTGDEEAGHSIVVDGAGGLFLIGSFSGTVDFDPGSGVHELTAPSDGFVLKLTTDGNFVWVAPTGAPNGLAVDCSGNIYITGQFAGTVDFSPTATPYPLTSAGGFDISLTRLLQPPQCADVTVSVSDGRGGSDTQTFMIDLNNRPPEITSTPVTTAAPGQTYHYDVDAIDADGDPLTYTLTTAPTGASIDSATGEISWAVPPELQFGFAFQLGAGEDDAKDPPAVTTDHSGNTYVTGIFQSTVDFDPGPGTFNLTSAGGEDIFVAKYSSSGALVWARRLGGSGTFDRGHGIAVDATGNVYTTGFFEGTADFDPGPGVFSLASAGGFDVFVSKLDSAGNFVWARRAGGSGADNSQLITLDGAGNVYTIGYFQGTADFDPGPAVFNLTSVGVQDAFVWKLDSAGALVWARDMGGDHTTLATGLALDAAGNIYTTGIFDGTADFDPGPGTFTLTSAGADDAFVAKLDAAGNFVWARRLGGSAGSDQGFGIAVDGAGNVYSAGQFWGTVDFDPGAGTFDLTSAGAEDIYVSKLDGAGNFVWARRMGGSGSDGGGTYITTGGSGSVYVSTRFSATADFDPGPGTFNLTSAGDSDGAVAKLNSAGDFVWARSFGGSGFDYSGKITVDDVGGVYVAGGFASTVDFDPGSTTFNLTSEGGSDNFVLKLLEPPVPEFTVRVEDGRGGSDAQRFTIDVSSAAPGEIHGTKFNDLNGNGIHDLGHLLVSGLYTNSVLRYDGGTGAFTDAFVSQGSGGLSGPAGVVFGPDGDLYVSSQQNSTTATVLRYDGESGGFIDSFVGPSGGLQARGYHVFGPDGNLYAVDENARSIKRYNGSTGAFIDVFASGGGLTSTPQGLGFGPDGNLYVTDLTDVVRFNGHTGVFMDVVVPAGRGGLNYPNFLAFGPDGNLYVSSYGTKSVLRYDARTGAFIGAFVPTGSGGLGGASSFVFGPDGNFYVADLGSQNHANRVLRYDGTTGAFLNVFVSVGSGGLDGANGVTFTPDAESGLGGWIIYLDQNHNNHRDPGERFTTTGADGSYSFPNLAAGTYTVGEEIPAGWQQTAPPGGTFTLTVVAGQIVTGNDFGNRQVVAPPPVNRPPAFVSTPPATATVGQLLRYDATASDPDSDPLTFDLVVKPAGMAIDPATGIVVWVPTADQVGAQDVTIRVRDGHGGVALQSFRISANRPNSTPVITSAPTGPAVVALPWQYQIRAQDADGDPIVFALTGPTGMSIDPTTGLVSWTPAADQVGAPHVAITASDGHGASATQSFDLPVVATAPNGAPAITSTPRFSVRIGDPYLYQVVASDPNSDPLGYSLDTAPTGMSIGSTGRVSWMPTAAQLGPNSVVVRVSDGRGGFATQGFTVQVVAQATNRAPTITSTPSAAGTVGRLYAYNLTGTDPDGDSLLWSLDSAPAGMSLDPQLGTLRWTPTSDQLGSQSVVVRAIDGLGGYATQSFTITVRALNLPPGITSTPPTAGASGRAYSYAVRASDPDGDPLAYRFTTAPAGMTIDATTGLVQWTPAAGQIGNQSVTVRAEDGQGGFADQSFTIVVSATGANHPPVVTSTPPLVATAAQPYSYAATATDPDGDAVLFSLLAAPDGMSIDPATGLIVWTPTLAQVGPQAVTVAAIDPSGAGGTQTFTIAVSDGNRAPTITSAPVQTVTAGLAYHYDVRASDPDGDRITYRLDQAPAGMTVDAFGRINWAPGIPDIGTHRVAVTVEDTRGASATQTFDVAVLADTLAPRINLFVSANPVNIGSPVTFVVTATDNVGVEALDLFINGASVPLDAAGRVTLLASPAGDYAIVARATDAAGRFSTATTTLSVFDTSDATPPDVDLTAPTDGAVVTGPVSVVGTATDSNLVSYVLEVAPTDTRAFTEIARGTSSVANGVLGTFDPSGLANGSYVIRLRATDTGGNESSIETSVEVAGDLKIGNFTLSFTDLSIPVSGIPITLARTYDTLQADRQDDFGFGWRMEFRDTDLRTSLAPTGEEAYGVYNGFRDGTRVYVTLPGGRREGFTFHPQRLSGFGGLLAFYSPSFVPDAGVTDQLSVPDNLTLIFVNGAYYSLNQRAFNPADTLNFAGTYTVTTKDGVAYTIDAVTGDLETVADTHGNALTFTDTDVTSSAGPRVTFARDPQGRITTVTDPGGHTVRYRYDLAGNLVGVTDRDGHVTQFVYDQPGRPHYLTEVIDPLGHSGVRTEYDDQGRLVKLIDAVGNPVRLAHDPNNALETVTDALGNATTFEYDPRGNVITEVNAAGGITRRTYDDANNMLTETDPLGRTRSFTYDGDGNVLTETDPLGTVTRNTYTTVTPGLFAGIRGARPVTLLATTTDPLGNTTTNEYSGTNLIATTDAAGTVTQFDYDDNGNQTSITDALGHVTRFQYDGRGNLTAQFDALNHATFYTYDDTGNQLTQATTLTTPGGVRTLTTATTFDANGHPLTTTDAEGHTTRTEYDALGRQAATIDALGRRTESVYDDHGQLTRTNFADGTFTATDYDAAGRRVSSTDRGGLVTHFVYDVLGRLTETIYPDNTPLTLLDNPRTGTEYDAAGEVRAQIDERGNRTEFDYDGAGRQIVVRDALGHETHTAYDAAGRTLSTTDALDHETQFGYDALGRQITTVFVDGTTTGTDYDALGRVVGRTDQLGRVTRFEYDALGRLTAVVDALDQRTEYGYDEAGDLIAQRDANAHVTHYEYDGLGRRTATVLPMGQRSETDFDAVGNVSDATDFDGATILYEYDPNNRLSAKHLPDGSTVRFTYTPDGQRETVTDARGVTRYRYDERNRLVARTDPDGTAIVYTYDAAGNRTSVTTPAGTTGYTFDPLNRTATVTDPETGVTRYTYNDVGNLARTDLPNGTAETRQYDALNRLVFLENRGPGGVISSYRYTLATTGRRDAVVEDTGRQVNYSYDALDRLTGETITDSAAGNRTFGYTYDPVGNRLVRTDTVEGTTLSAYDANDRLLTETTGGSVTAYTYDANGNTLAKNAGPTDRAAYTWDAENRLIAADLTDATGTKHIENRYDADGIRVSQVTDGAETRYLIDTVQPYAQVVLEYRPGGLVVVSYVYGNDLISQTRDGAKSFYHVDGLGSTRALTNAAGAVTDRCVYDAFGRTIDSSGMTVNSYLFAGEQRDAGMGLDYLRARYLNVGAGRFMSTDPFPGSLKRVLSLNKYQYGYSNPLSNTDPSGAITLADVVLPTILLAGVAGGLALGGSRFSRESALSPDTIGFGVYASAEVPGTSTHVVVGGELDISPRKKTISTIQFGGIEGTFDISGISDVIDGSALPHAEIGIYEALYWNNNHVPTAPSLERFNLALINFGNAFLGFGLGTNPVELLFGTSLLSSSHGTGGLEFEYLSGVDYEVSSSQVSLGSMVGTAALAQLLYSGLFLAKGIGLEALATPLGAAAGLGVLGLTAGTTGAWVVNNYGRE